VPVTNRGHLDKQRSAKPTCSGVPKRDRALLALGFAGAFRRNELCALDVADLVETPDCAC